MAVNSNGTLSLKIEDTVVVNADNDNILFVTFLKNIADDANNTKQAQSGVGKCYKIISEQSLENPAKVIVDLRPMGNHNHVSPQARDIYKNFIIDPRVAKVAVLGSSGTQATITNFVLNFNGGYKDKLAWFSNETEAKYWVNQ